jgi:hypothetical protein
MLKRSFLLLVFFAFPMAGFCQYNPSPYKIDEILAAMKKPYSDLVLVSAHRASWQNYPELSLPAILDVFDRKIETIEVDARLTQDNHVVISHDYKVDRVSTGTGYLYQTPWSQLQTYNLRDRLGHVYTDSHGDPQHFLDFSSLLTIMQDHTNTPYGYVVIVDIKGAVDDSDPSDPMQILQDCIALMNQAQQAGDQPDMLKGIVFKMKSKDLPTRAAFEQVTGWNSAQSGGLIIVLNPDDAPVVSAAGDPTQNSFFMSWLTAPYMIHYEMNNYYNGDALQPYINYLQNPANHAPIGFATYFEPYYFPEGVANSKGYCCFAHSMNAALTSPPLDYRGVTEFSILYGTALVTTDATDALIQLLTATNRRNLSHIQ